MAWENPARLENRQLEADRFRSVVTGGSIDETEGVWHETTAFSLNAVGDQDRSLLWQNAVNGLTTLALTQGWSMPLQPTRWPG